MQLRKHQRDFSNLVDRIVAGEPIHTITLHVVPGGGKSAIPIIAGRLITEGLADAIAWIVPRKSLQDQGERNFLDPHFRRLLDHRLTIRSSTNESNPCRGQNGFITTYQAIGVDNDGLAYRDFLQRRYILILDEFHHCEQDGPWAKSLAPLMGSAKYVVLMSGTLERGDGSRIAFIPYAEEEPKIFRPSPCEGQGASFIRYSRTAALMERAIIPLRFFLSDGHVEWETRQGRKMSGRLSSMESQASAALFTALNTDFADDLLTRGLNHWVRHKATHPSSKLLVVTANFKHARHYTDLLKNRGFRAKIATSHDSPSALRNIKEFRFGSLDILVTIAMAYEGLDVPQASHIVSLTHIRTVPWIEQMISRAVRIDPAAGPYESQVAYIFAPDDPLFSQVVEEIQQEQLPLAHGREKEEPAQQKLWEMEGEPEPWINPLAGQITGDREVSMYGGTQNGFDHQGELTTIKDQEEDLLRQIERHVARFSFENYYKPERINAEIKGYFGKPRRLMTIRELEECLKFVKTTYPLNGGRPGLSFGSPPRGRGRRVPSKAQPWEGI